MGYSVPHFGSDAVYRDCAVSVEGVAESGNEFRYREVEQQLHR